jgi:hypothetical protein
MEAKPKKSFLSGIPAWALSLLTLLFTTIFMFVIAYPLQKFKMNGEDVGDWITYIITGILIGIALFFICRKFPSSIWYSPIICNAVGIILAIEEPHFWGDSLAKAILIEWFISLTGALIGRWIGITRANEKNIS